MSWSHCPHGAESVSDCSTCTPRVTGLAASVLARAVKAEARVAELEGFVASVRAHEICPDCHRVIETRPCTTEAARAECSMFPGATCTNPEHHQQTDKPLPRGADDDPAMAVSRLKLLNGWSLADLTQAEYEWDLQVIRDLYERARSEAAPIPVVVHCPMCRAQHIDEGEWATTRHHRTHRCQECGCDFRLADVPTVGVRALPTVSG